MSEVREFPVQFEPAAFDQIRRLLERKGHPGAFLRVGVKGGGCTGLEYVLKIEDRRLDFDLEYEQDGILVVCDAKSAMYLAGSTLKWTGNLIGGGFQFDNPNAERSCGCGTSFSVRRPSAG
jgi:iron-sulfur cluster assembly protein